MPYAANTKVPIERSRQEIERVLKNYGADEFFYGTSSRGAGIGFKYKSRVIKIGIPYPNKSSYEFSSQAAYDREYRRRWRVLLIALKAKLELVDADLSTFEDEFLAQTCLPDGSIVGDWAKDQINTMIETGKMPKLLPSGI